MTKLIVAAALASLVLMEPAVAGGLSEPVLDQQTVMDAAVEDSTAKVDILMITLLYVFFIAAVGGAF